jgi:acyl-CoA synthetase (AMP-forming)/AMP-acid ligase II
MILDDEATLQRYRTSGWWGDVTVDDLFRACVEAAPEQLALVDAPDRPAFCYGAPRRLSFAETDTCVDALAAALLAAGVRKDSVVVVQLPNIAEIVIAFLACARLGAIASPVMLAYGERDMRRILRHLRPACVLALASYKDQRPADSARRILAEAGSPATAVIAFGEGEGEDVGEGEDAHEGAGEVADVRDLDGDTGALRDYLDGLTVDANEIVTMHWTSGTTGNPKCVPRSHNQWHATGGCCRDAGGLHHGDRLLAPMQMVHTAGYNGLFMPWLEVQGTLALHNPFDMGIFLDQLEELGIHHTVAAPAMLNALLRENILDHRDVSSIRSILCGSAPLDAWMIEGFRERYGIEVVNAFGSTEGITLLSGPTMTGDPHRRARYFPRFRGSAHKRSDGTDWGIRIARGVESKLVDVETGREITEPGQPGEFLFRSPALFPGYWTAEGTVDRDDFDAEGYFRTGELFEIAGDGEDADYFHYIDRLKDVINRGGLKIPAGELESAIQALPEVQEAAAVGYPDERLGERICAVVVTVPGTSLSFESLIEQLSAAGVARFMWPERLELVEALPRNPTGKVLKGELVRLLLAANSEATRTGVG